MHLQNPSIRKLFNPLILWFITVSEPINEMKSRRCHQLSKKKKFLEAVKNLYNVPIYIFQAVNGVLIFKPKTSLTIMAYRGNYIYRGGGYMALRT